MAFSISCTVLMNSCKASNTESEFTQVCNIGFCSPGCFTLGETYEEAISGHFDALIMEGHTSPNEPYPNVGVVLGIHAAARKRLSALTHA